MDPNACLQRLRDALEDRDWTEAADAARDLAGWLNGGGFMPDPISPRTLALILERLARSL